MRSTEGGNAKAMSMIVTKGTLDRAYPPRILATTAGDTLQVLATDPGAVKDFQAYCRATGHQLLESGEDAGVYSFLIKKVA